MFDLCQSYSFSVEVPRSKRGNHSAHSGFIVQSKHQLSAQKVNVNFFPYLWQPLWVPRVPRDDLLKPLETVVDGWLIQCCRQYRETERGMSKNEKNAWFIVQLQRVICIILTEFTKRCHEIPPGQRYGVSTASYASSPDEPLIAWSCCSITLTNACL